MRLERHWKDGFLKWHPELAHKVARPRNRDRALAQEPVRIESSFNRFSEVKSRFKIQEDDIWNSDEKGFAIGQAIGGKLFCGAGKSNTHLVQDGGREWATLVEMISATGKSIPPFFVYQAKSELESSHDYVERDEATFSICSTGYMHKRLSLKWLEEHFHFTTPPTPQVPTAYSSLTIIPLTKILTSTTTVGLIRYSFIFSHLTLPTFFNR